MANSCNGCGLCCRLFLINLSKEEYESGIYTTVFPKGISPDKFSEAQNCGAILLAKKEDDCCIYLEDNKCSIHANRPKVCRAFFCTTKACKFQSMVKVIREKDRQKISLCHSTTKNQQPTTKDNY
jgi:Fe-S-cluster containining protein